jgi:hypothetical protein
MSLTDLFAAIDPGFSGALCALSVDGSYARVWHMPVKHQNFRSLDLPALKLIGDELVMLPIVKVGLENPTTRPGEGAERCFRFGRGIGNLEMLLEMASIPYLLIAPNLWKGRLGIPGKELDPMSIEAKRYFLSHYPQHEHLILGPRGGLLDGVLDAFLIAHFLIMSYTSPVGTKGGKRPPTFRGMPNAD